MIITCMTDYTPNGRDVNSASLEAAARIHAKWEDRNSTAPPISEGNPRLVTTIGPNGIPKKYLVEVVRAYRATVVRE